MQIGQTTVSVNTHIVSPAGTTSFLAHADIGGRTYGLHVDAIDADQACDQAIVAWNDLVSNPDETWTAPADANAVQARLTATLASRQDNLAMFHVTHTYGSELAAADVVAPDAERAMQLMDAYTFGLCGKHLMRWHGKEIPVVTSDYTLPSYPPPPVQPEGTILSQHVTAEFLATLDRLHPTARTGNAESLQGALAGAVSDRGYYTIVNMFLDDRRIVHHRAKPDGTFKLTIIDDSGMNTYETASEKIRTHANSILATLAPLSTDPDPHSRQDVRNRTGRTCIPAGFYQLCASRTDETIDALLDQPLGERVTTLTVTTPPSSLRPTTTTANKVDATTWRDLLDALRDGSPTWFDAVDVAGIEIRGATCAVQLANHDDM